MNNIIERICLWNNRRYDQEYSNKLTDALLTEELAELRRAHVANDTVETLDALVDITYVAIGAMWKLGLDKDQVRRAIEAVCESNESKKAVKTKSNIKANIDKGADYFGPEKLLRGILDER